MNEQLANQVLLPAAPKRHLLNRAHRCSVSVTRRPFWVVGRFSIIWNVGSTGDGMSHHCRQMRVQHSISATF